MTQRRVDLVQLVHFTNVPPDARLTLEAEVPEERTVIANHVQGDLAVPFTYQADEAVDNGISRRSGMSRPLTVSIAAPGYMPRTVRITIPETAAVNASLDPAPLEALTISPGALDDYDAGLERVLSGRCAEAGPLLARAGSAATGRREPGHIANVADRCWQLSLLEPPPSTWTPASADVPPELVESPQSAASALAMMMAKERDVAGRKALDRLVLDVQLGHLNDAARLAALIAEPLPAKRAALVLRLPRGLLAAARLRESLQALASGDSRGALELAAEAQHIDPLVAPGVYAHVREERVDALVKQSVDAETSGNALLARGYLQLAGALVPSALSVHAGFDRTRAAALQTVELRLAIVGDQALGQEIARAFPPYITIVSSPANADALLTVNVDEPRREYRISRSHRSVEIKIGHVESPNPEYASAQERVRSAAERLDSARIEAAKLKQQSLDSARQIAATNSGTWGAVAAGVAASVGEGGGDYLIVDAENDLRSARSELASTPRMTSEDVTEAAQYPVISISTTASVHLAVRLEGVGDAIDDQGDASAQTSTEAVIGAAEIRVDSEQADLSTSMTLTPDLRTSAREIGQRLAARIAAFESSAAWSEFEARRDNGDVLGAAAIGAAVVDLSGDAHRDEVIAYLLENLP